MLMDLLKSVAPGLATAVGGPMAGMAVKAIADKLGCAPDEASVANAIQADPAAALKLAEIDLKQFQLENEDRANARAMQIAAIQTDDKFVRRFTYYLAAFWSLLSCVYIGFITFAHIPEQNMRFADTILGVVISGVIGTIISFYFGSSKSSQDKTVALAGKDKK
jgi:hypothetical protein